MKTYISSTYLRDINKYIYYQYTCSSYHIVLKKILETKPYVINEDGVDLKILDNNYYIMEIVPVDKKYIFRVHLDDNMNVIERYYTVSLGNDTIDNIPVFENMKLSYVCCDFQRKKYNEQFVENLYKQKAITRQQYIQIKTTFSELIEEVENGTNIFYNLNYPQLIKECEGGIICK